jgi:hypothetical protein
MPEGPDTRSHHHADDASASSTDSGIAPEAIDTKNSEAQVTDPGAIPQDKKPLWGKAVRALREVSDKTSSAGVGIAGKVADLAASNAAKSAQVGKQTFASATGSTRDALEAGKGVYSGSKLESAVNYIDRELDQRGAKKALKETAEAVAGKVDQVTGKRLIELLEEKLRVQDAYNDILATRLAEALDRIAALEARFNESTRSEPGSAKGETSELDAQ